MTILKNRGFWLIWWTGVLETDYLTENVLLHPQV